MSSAGKTILIMVLVLGAMLLLTYASPEILAYASELARNSKLPVWLVGLAAPILFVFKRLGEFISGLVGETGTERRIRETNDAVRGRVAELETEVRRLEDWRRAEIDRREAAVRMLERQVGAGRERVADLDAAAAGVLEERDRLRGTLREDPGDIE